MRIMTEAEYQSRIKEAYQKGYEEASSQRFKEQRENEFRDDIWRAVRETREDLGRQIMALRDALRAAGIKDPTGPMKSCDEGCMTPVCSPY